MAIRGGDPSMWNCETVVRAPKSQRPLAPPRGAPRPLSCPPTPPDDEAETLLIRNAYHPRAPRGPSRGPSRGPRPTAPTVPLYAGAGVTAAPAPSLFFEERDRPTAPDPIPPSVRPVIWLLTAVFLVVIGCRVVPAAVDRVTSVTGLLEAR